MLVLDGKTDLNQISLTGVRAIMLLGLLAVAPRTLEEIRNAFLNYKIMDSSHSDDILRIDINTLKSFGCEISRSSAKTDYKYILSKHPFTLPITEDDIKILKKVFNNIQEKVNISSLLQLDKFLKKVSKYIYDDEMREHFIGVSPLRYYDIDKIRELEFSCLCNYTVKLMYKKQYVQHPVQKAIVAQKLLMKNEKLYFYGYDIDKKEPVTLLFKRIKSIVSKQITEEQFEQKNFKVKFMLINSWKDFLTEEEQIINESDTMFCTEGNYFNEFTAIQRILSFGADCIVIEPSEFKLKIISKLKEMRTIYAEK